MKDIMRLFGTLAAYMTAFIAVMGTINIIFDLNWALGTYGSATPLPTDFGELGFLVVFLFIFSGLLWLSGSIGDLFRVIKRKPIVSFTALAVGTALLIVVGNISLTWMMGGPLMRAIEMGNMQQAQVLLQENSYEPEALRQPLYFALKRENYALADSIVEAGADVNYVSDNEFGTPLLHSSVFHFEAEAIEFLLERGAKPNVQDNLGRTAMMIAVNYRDTSFPAEEPTRVLKMLHEAGGDLSMTDNEGNTVGAIAEQWNNTPALDYLAQVSGSDESASAK